jgi:hypothetical protein
VEEEAARGRSVSRLNVLIAIPAFIVLVLIVRLPDTARWLLMNG